MSVELFRGITLHHKDGYDVHPIIKDGGVKIGGEVVSGDEAIVKALLAGGATRGTNDQGQGNGNYRIGKPATPTYTLASELAHLDQGSASEQPAPVTAEPTPASKPSPTPASVKLEGNELDDTIESKGKYVIWGIIIVALAVVVMNT